MMVRSGPLAPLARVVLNETSEENYHISLQHPSLTLIAYKMRVLRIITLTKPLKTAKRRCLTKKRRQI